MNSKDVTRLRIRKATVRDCVAMRDIINKHADEGLMLHKSLNQLILLLPQYFVAVIDGVIVAVCGYKIWPSEGVEIISSAVIQTLHGMGIGRRMIFSCVEEAQKMGFKKFFTLTFQSGFFAKLGFFEVPKESLSSKIYTDCMYCRKNRSNEPDKIECDDVAMRFNIS